MNVNGSACSVRLRLATLACLVLPLLISCTDKEAEDKAAERAARAAEMARLASVPETGRHRHVTDTLPTSMMMESKGLIGGMTVDANGNIYNANFNESLWRTEPDGKTVLLSNEFSQASGNLELPNGDLLQADWKEHKIFRIAPDGQRVLFVDGGLNGPVGMATLHSGEIVIANYTGKFLAKTGPDGGKAVKYFEDPRLTGPNGVSVDDKNNIYIADLNSPIVFKLTPELKLIELARLPGGGNAHNVVVDDGLYVNKIWDQAIFRVELDGSGVKLVSGTGTKGFTDGPVGVSTIEEPNGIAVAPSKSMVYFNSQKGEMFGGGGEIILRRLLIKDAPQNPL